MTESAEVNAIRGLRGYLGPNSTLSKGFLPSTRGLVYWSEVRDRKSQLRTLSYAIILKRKRERTFLSWHL